jgi:MerR family transcriptional regulator, aldehyde-responsive regulator
MRIAEAADQCGLNIDTIRYYEKSGLLPEIRRGTDGKRRFTAENIDWLVLLGSLRDTGMSMKVMALFADLYRQGDQTIPERRQILLQHSEQLNRKRQQLDRCEELLSYKLKRYDEREAKSNMERKS